MVGELRGVESKCQVYGTLQCQNVTVNTCLCVYGTHTPPMYTYSCTVSQEAYAMKKLV